MPVTLPPLKLQERPGSHAYGILFSVCEGSTFASPGKRRQAIASIIHPVADGCAAPFRFPGERCVSPYVPVADPPEPLPTRSDVGSADSKVWVRLSVRQGFRSPHPHHRQRTSAKPLLTHHSEPPLRGKATHRLPARLQAAKVTPAALR